MKFKSIKAICYAVCRVSSSMKYIEKAQRGIESHDFDFLKLELTKTKLGECHDLLLELQKDALIGE